MNGLLHLLERHWLSVVLIVGAIAAIYLVYKERSKIMMNEDE